MIGIAAVRSGLGRVMTALAKEEDPIARAELLRALIVIGSEPTDRKVLQQLHQLPGHAVTQIVRTLATLRPKSLVTFLVEGGVLATLQPVASAHAADVMGRLLRVAPDEAARLETEAARLAPGTLQGLLHHAHSTARLVAVPALLAGLRMDVFTAGEVLSYLPEIHGRPSGIGNDDPLRQAYGPWRDQLPTTGDATHDFVLALIDRWLGRTSAAPDVAQVDPALLQMLQLPTTALAVLSPAERAELVRRLEWKDEAARRVERARFERQTEPWSWEARAHGGVLLTDLPAASLADLVRVTGCRPSPFATDRGAMITYRADGRPSAMGVAPPALDSACDRAVKTIAAVTYGAPTLAQDEPSKVLLRLQPEFVSCQQDRDRTTRKAAPSTPVETSFQQVVRPRKIHDQKPVYPAAAQAARVQGVVIIDAFITETGCVSEARVTRSIPGLDLMALQAVSYWRYAPAMKGDTPVAVLMTVTVNFTLR